MKKTFLSINNSITTKVKMGNGALVDAKGKSTISINMKGCGKKIHDVFMFLTRKKICLLLVNSWKMVILLWFDIIIA